MIGARAFQFLVKRLNIKFFTFNINTINHAVKKNLDNNI